MKTATMISLASPDLRLIIFGGKGGSGKTTSAAAAALYLNKIYPEKKILVISVDPAHSLADSFDTIVDGNNASPIMANIWCMEINAQELLAEYKVRYGDIIKEIANRATYFDKQDIDGFLDLSLPGSDEVMAIFQIAELIKAGEYDLIILDTAPTGHTRVLLSLPEKMQQWVNLMGILMEKHRYIVKAMTGRYREDECDAFIKNQRNDIRRVRALLVDNRITEFVPVTTPEPMSIIEVEKLVQTLLKDGVPIKNLIVNQVVEERECPFCTSRWQQQQASLQDIEDRFASFNLAKIPLFPHQIRGHPGLLEYAQILFEDKKYSTPGQELASNLVNPVDKERHSRILLGECSFIIFGGKGGVGKSIIAAASALHLAKTKPNQEVLIFSADPSHSLSDAFGIDIGNKATKIGQMDNLHALEIDGKELLEDFKQELHNDIEQAVHRFVGGGVDIKFDRNILQELLSVTPPGLDELMALREIVGFLNDGRYNLFILDSAASGHLLRLLELPQLVKDWLNATFRLLVKYKGLTGTKLYDATERLIDLSKQMRGIIDALSDPQKTEFVLIAIPEAMAVAETQDLASSLSNLKIPSSNLIVNMVTPPTECNFCARKSAEQTKYMEEIETKFPNHNIVYLPLFAQPIRGVEELSKLAQTLYREDSKYDFVSMITKAKEGW